MATPSVSAVLGMPEIAAAIDACTELYPGVAASKENVAPLWAHMCQKAAWGMQLKGTVLMFARRMEGSRKNASSRLSVSVEGPREPVRGAPDPNFPNRPIRAHIDCKLFDWTVDGFIEALIWAKDVVDRVEREDFCPRCRVDGYRALPRYELPVKRLRSRPLAYCVDCAMEVALGEPPVKRAHQ